ncbi:MAG: hypothetical protein Ct9H300mP6_08970 [Gammaproteobacteria bacterium]|nr:MAG: hypothetical protein Ct9H300mP6_08970 [Gammaproteobacteria bacterium]
MYWRDTEWPNAYNYESYSSFGFPGTFYSPYFGYVADSRCPDVPVGELVFRRQWFLSESTIR